VLKATSAGHGVPSSSILLLFAALPVLWTPPVDGRIEMATPGQRELERLSARLKYCARNMLSINLGLSRWPGDICDQSDAR
jgi:hypothetical protein